MRKIFLIFILVCLWLGGSNIWNGVFHRTPTAIALGETKPSDFPGHVALQNVSLSLLGAVSGKEFGANVVFLPARPRNATTPGPLQVLVRTNDKEVIAVASETKSDDIDRMKRLATLYPTLAARSEIVGTTESFGTEKQRTALKRLLPDLADDFVVIREGNQPSIILGFVFLTIGVGLMLLADKLSRGKTPSATPPVLSHQPPLLPPKLPPSLS